MAGRPRKIECRHSAIACERCVANRLSARHSFLRGILREAPRVIAGLTPYDRAHYLAEGGGW